MEIPDVIVVNKADHPLTDTMVREIKGVLALGPHEGWQVPIVRTEAVRGEGIEELVERLAEHREYIEAEGTLSERRRRNLMNEVLAIATLPDAPRARGLDPRGPRDPGAARQRGHPRARPRQRGDPDPRGAGATDERSDAHRSSSPAGAVRRRRREAALPGRREALRSRPLGLPPSRARCPRSRRARAGIALGPRSPSSTGPPPSRVARPVRLFAVVSLVLARRRAAAAASASATCPPRWFGSALSAALALVALAVGDGGAARHRLGARARRRPARRHAAARRSPEPCTRPSSPTPSCRSPGASGARDDASPERLATAVGSLLERRMSRRGAVAQGGGRGLGVRRRADPLPRPARNRVGRDRPRQLLLRACALDGYTAFCCEIEHGQQRLPERHLRGRLVEVHRLQGRRPVPTRRACATTSTATGIPGHVSPAGASARTATATTGGSTATTSATASATRRSRARPRSCAGW